VAVAQPSDGAPATGGRFVATFKSRTLEKKKRRPLPNSLLHPLFKVAQQSQSLHLQTPILHQNQISIHPHFTMAPPADVVDDVDGALPRVPALQDFLARLGRLLTIISRQSIWMTRTTPTRSKSSSTRVWPLNNTRRGFLRLHANASRTQSTRRGRRTAPSFTI